MPAVLNKYVHGIPEGSVYIGRGSQWGNPFRISPSVDRDAAIAAYEEWLVGNPVLLNQLDELAGRDLVCYCAPKRCHGDLLLRLANGGNKALISWYVATKRNFSCK